MLSYQCIAAAAAFVKCRARIPVETHFRFWIPVILWYIFKSEEKKEILVNTSKLTERSNHYKNVFNKKFDEMRFC